VIDPIQVPLPCDVLTSEWRECTDEMRQSDPVYPALEAAFMDACAKPGWNPKTVQLGDGLLAVDFCSDSATGRLHSYHVAKIEDHPFLATLPSNAPRAVRHPYRAATRLRYLRATDALSFMEDMDRADDAAWVYNEAAMRSEAAT
jgi:hypothetical protein